MHKISSKNIKVSIEKTWKNYQKYAKKYTKSSSSRQRHTLKKYSVVTITVIPRIFVVNFTRKDHAIFKTFRRICQNGLKIPQNDPQQRRRNLLWFFFVKSPSTRIITIISAIFDEKRVISSQEIAIYKKAIIHKIRQYCSKSYNLRFSVLDCFYPQILDDVYLHTTTSRQCQANNNVKFCRLIWTCQRI